MALVLLSVSKNLINNLCNFHIFTICFSLWSPLLSRNDSYSSVRRSATVMAHPEGFLPVVLLHVLTNPRDHVLCDNNNENPLFFHD